MTDTSTRPCWCDNDQTTGGHYHRPPVPKPKWVLSCMSDGPSVLFPDDELADTSCQRQKGHTHEHRWFSDDGSVIIRWEDEWSFAEGEWRRHLDD